MGSKGLEYPDKYKEPAPPSSLERPSVRSGTLPEAASKARSPSILFVSPSDRVKLAGPKVSLMSIYNSFGTVPSWRR